MDFVSLSSHACPTESFQMFSISHLLPFTSNAKWIQIHQAVSAQYPSFPSKPLNIHQTLEKNNVIKEFLKVAYFDMIRYIERKSKNLM